MSTHEFVLEIGCEDIPARFVEAALSDLKTRLLDACKNARIDATFEAFATPRRFALLGHLAADQRDLEEVRTGPPIAAAFKDGQPTRAAQGFAQGQGVDVNDLFTVKTEKGEYVAAKVFEKGRPTADVLPAILETLVAQTSFPKSMRWGDNKVTFARPVRWIVAVFNGEVVPFEWGNVKSGKTTRGHRFAAPTPFDVTNHETYLSGLADAHVVLKQEQRRKTILAGLERAASDVGGRVIPDPSLVDEVIHLVEEPHVLAVKYDEAYLELPPEVLISSMRSHQRYFAFQDPNGKLIAACGVVYNTPVRDPAVVAAGNLRVLKARLDDARFFWKQDLRIPLEQYNHKLENVVWLKQIGSVRERAQRMTKTAVAIANALHLNAETVQHTHRAGDLSKADLATGMVGEFPDLQGVMGREYAKMAGEPAEVAVAIYEQYLPKGAELELPKTHAGACLALAEKLDSLVGCFGIGLIPTASADPYALRRAALGTLRILQGMEYAIELGTLLELAANSYPESFFKTDQQTVCKQVAEFVSTRLRHSLVQTFPTDLVDAVLAVGLADVLSVHDRVEALARIRPEADFEPLAQGFKRVVNILKKQQSANSHINADLLNEDSEKALFTAVSAAQQSMKAATAQRDWHAACQTLISLKQPVDGFFDSVMVMAEDPAVRENRLALLGATQSLFFQVADLSVIS